MQHSYNLDRQRILGEIRKRCIIFVRKVIFLFYIIFFRALLIYLAFFKELGWFKYIYVSTGFLLLLFVIQLAPVKMFEYLEIVSKSIIFFF